MKIDEFERNEKKTTLNEKKTNMLLASFMLFVFPIILVVIGVMLGQYIAKSIGASILIFRVLGGIIAFILAVVLIKIYDKSAVVDAKEEKIHWDDM